MRVLDVEEQRPGDAVGAVANGGHNGCETRNLSVGGDDRGNTSSGDWDPGYYKAECAYGKVAYGVSVDTANGTPSRLLCWRRLA